MITGSCLCGRVRYTIRGGLGSIVCCHCSECRRASGTAFATNATVRAEEFSLAPGAPISEYESSPGKFRAFCARCGSPIYARMSRVSGVIRLRLGTLDLDPGDRPRAHVFVSDKAPWCEPEGALEAFDGWPPGEYLAPPSR